MSLPRSLQRLLTGVALLALSVVAHAQRDFSKVEITTTRISESLYMLQGAGGNIGVSIGSDGVYLIDDQFAPLSEKILTAIRALSDAPIRFVLNTHWHGDHTGGNENIAAEGATVIAHDNVRTRMSAPQAIPAFGREVPAAPEVARPQLTFSNRATFHLNGETARAIHVPNAHTDGDSFVHFERANIVHTGDLFFNGFYPFIDVWNGGSLEGMIAAADALLLFVDENTRIIPGHGQVAGRADLVNFQAMLKTVHEAVSKAIKSGQSAEELVASGVLDEVDASWGKGFLSTDKFIGIVMTGMRAK